MTQVHLADQVYAETAAVKQQKMPKKKKAERNKTWILD